MTNQEKEQRAKTLHDFIFRNKDSEDEEILNDVEVAKEALNKLWPGCEEKVQNAQIRINGGDPEALRRLIDEIGNRNS